MANNQYVNKVELGHQTIVDISDTTATASDVVSGKKFYAASGEPVNGSLVPGTITEVQANGTSVATSGIANIPAASTSQYGVTKLNNTLSSTSTTEAAAASVARELNQAITGLSDELSNNTFQEITPTGSRCTVVSGGIAIVGKLAVINVKIHSAYSATNTPSMISINSAIGTPKCTTALACVKSGAGQGSMSGAIACHIGLNRQIYMQSAENDAYYDISGVVVLA